MNRESDNLVRQAIDANLCFLNSDGQTAQRIIHHAQNTRSAKRKLSFIPVLSILLLLLLTVAACATFTFGVLDFRPERADDPSYLDSIVSIDSLFKTNWMTVSVNEAAFDGSRLDFTMDIRHIDGADVVYVIPDIQANCGGMHLPVFIKAINFNWEEGFFLPEQQPLHKETEQAGISFILEQAPDQGTIDWTLTFDILRPIYPLELNDKSLDAEDGEEEIPFDVYIQDYIDAYENKIILLSEYGSLVMYDGALSMGKAFGENPWYREGLAQRMIDCGAFERIATFTTHFLTDIP